MNKYYEMTPDFSSTDFRRGTAGSNPSRTDTISITQVTEEGTVRVLVAYLRSIIGLILWKPLTGCIVMQPV